MRDTELYRHLLGLEAPWFVSGVELDVKGQRVEVHAEHASRNGLTTLRNSPSTGWAASAWPAQVLRSASPMASVRVWLAQAGQRLR